MMFLVAPVLVFTAFLLLLLASLSAPIINSIYLFRLSTSIRSSLLEGSVSTSASFGVWGYCLSGIQAKSNVIGISKSTDGLCSDIHLGYTIDNTVANALNATELNHTISSATTGVLVLHPIVTAFAFVTLLLSLFILRRGSSNARLPSIVTIFVGSFAAFLTTVVFLIDVIMVAIVHNIVSDKTDGAVDVTYGNAVWMVLGAAIALWVAALGICTGVCACGKNRTRKSSAY